MATKTDKHQFPLSNHVLIYKPLNELFQSYSSNGFVAFNPLLAYRIHNLERDSFEFNITLSEIRGWTRPRVIGIPQSS